jgi:capsule polysaccharide export protein KpsE/RkpR
VTPTAVKPQREIDPHPDAGEISLPDVTPDDSGARQVDRLRLIWKRRKFLVRAGTVALVASTVVAFLIPKSYTSTAQLMPPDPQSSGGMAMMAAMATKTGGDLGTIAGDLLGLKSSGALFIGVLRSETSQDRLIQQFDLRKVYGRRLMVDARARLDGNTAISEDRKSGIVTISVTDHSPQRAAALANAYVDQLNSLVSELSTTSARRERVFLEERLKVVKGDLDDASNQLAQFSSKNSTLDIQQEGKAMLDAAGTIAGEMIAAQSELEGLRQIYTDNNSRVRALNARVAELRKQLEKLGGAQAKDAEPAATPSGPSADPAPAQVGGLPYPTIRNLPLLGAKYGDYYRRAKIEETVYELLTEQFELAKVQEAKETPSVKVLDPARVPEKKSSPHRLQIILLGTFLGSALSVMWVVGSARWEEFDPKDPRKVLVEEVTGTLKARTPWASRNGSAPESSPQEIADRSGTQGPLASGPVSQ